MLKAKRAIYFLVGAISFAIPALGSSHTAKFGAKVFVLRGINETTRVVPIKDLSHQTGVFMRMPDLAGESSSQKPSQKYPEPEKAQTGSSAYKSIITRTENGQPAEKIKPLKFSSAKITGTLRLPRVKFARVGLPMEIRDELPSLDFTQKSLKDGGF